MSQPVLKTVEYHEAVIESLELAAKLAEEIHGPESEQLLRVTEKLDIQLQRIEEIEDATEALYTIVQWPEITDSTPWDVADAKKELHEKFGIPYKEIDRQQRETAIPGQRR